MIFQVDKSNFSREFDVKKEEDHLLGLPLAE